MKISFANAIGCLCFSLFFLCCTTNSAHPGNQLPASIKKEAINCPIPVSLMKSSKGNPAITDQKSRYAETGKPAKSSAN